MINKESEESIKSIPKESQSELIDEELKNKEKDKPIDLLKHQRMVRYTWMSQISNSNESIESNKKKSKKTKTLLNPSDYNKTKRPNFHAYHHSTDNWLPSLFKNE